MIHKVVSLFWPILTIISIAILAKLVKSHVKVRLWLLEAVLQYPCKVIAKE